MFAITLAPKLLAPDICNSSGTSIWMFSRARLNTYTARHPTFTYSFSRNLFSCLLFPFCIQTTNTNDDDDDDDDHHVGRHTTNLISYSCRTFGQDSYRRHRSHCHWNTCANIMLYSFPTHYGAPNSGHLYCQPYSTASQEPIAEAKKKIRDDVSHHVATLIQIAVATEW